MRRQKVKRLPVVEALLLVLPGACLFSFIVPLAVSSQCGYMKCEKLIQAGYEGDVDRARRLLDEGVDIDCREDNGEKTALMAASESAHLSLVEFLIARGANPFLKDSGGQTAYDKARYNHRPDAARTARSLKNYMSDLREREKRR